MCLFSFLRWGSIGYSLGIVQWDFTRRDHPGNPRRVSGSGLVNMTIREYLAIEHLFISPKMRGQNLMSRSNHVFSCGMVIKNLGTCYGI